MEKIRALKQSFKTTSHEGHPCKNYVFVTEGKRIYYETLMLISKSEIDGVNYNGEVVKTYKDVALIQTRIGFQLTTLQTLVRSTDLMLNKIDELLNKETL